VNKFRQRHPDFGKVAKAPPAEKWIDISNDPETVQAVAAGHRSRVIEKDLKAKARRNKTRG
jgi:hypothetical protein